MAMDQASDGLEDEQVKGTMTDQSIDSDGYRLPYIPKILPHEKVFPIQIGTELFRLSGASISSDGNGFCFFLVAELRLTQTAPSYFSEFFVRQLEEKNGDVSKVRTLYIDRDALTFRDISRHLQGYNVQPQDGSHFVKLFADAQFYRLPKLISQLFESEIFIKIGHRNFQVPRDIFSSPGDSPNYFTLGFAVFFAIPGQTFPGLNREGLLRPPSILPPSVPNRSADIFAELLHLLRGYPLHIRNEEHRAALLRDCRYFHLRGLEQKLVPCEKTFNLKRHSWELTIKLEDIKPSGVSLASDFEDPANKPVSGRILYSRPFIDDESYDLILQIGGERTSLSLQSMRVRFFNDAQARMSSLLQVVANKLKLPTTQPLGLLMQAGSTSSQGTSPGKNALSEDHVPIGIDPDTHVTLDGQELTVNELNEALSPRNGLGHSPNGEQFESIESTPHITLDTPHPGSDHPAISPEPNQQRRQSQSRMLHEPGQPPRKRKRKLSLSGPEHWIVQTGLWRLNVQPAADENDKTVVKLIAVKLDAYRGELGRNTNREFLSS